MAFRRPQSNTVDRDDSGAVLTINKSRHLSIVQQRQRLPIRSQRENVLYALEKYSTVVVTAETGSGKSTQLPQYFHETGWTKGNRCIVCTQPRRMAAITVAARVAEELGCELGEEVG
jgi:ATP-dependent RNA helicase DDX35